MLSWIEVRVRLLKFTAAGFTGDASASFVARGPLEWSHFGPFGQSGTKQPAMPLSQHEVGSWGRRRILNLRHCLHGLRSNLVSQPHLGRS